MNFTFTWILDKFGLQPKFEVTPVAKKATTVAKKATKVAVKKTVRKPKAK